MLSHYLFDWYSMSFELDVLDEEEDEINAAITGMLAAYHPMSTEKTNILRPILYHVMRRASLGEIDQNIFDLGIFMILYIVDETGNYEMLLATDKLDMYLNSIHVCFMVAASSNIEDEFEIEYRDDFFSFMSEQYIKIHDVP